MSRRRGPKPGTPQARHGGLATAAKYGREHYRDMGRKGGAALVDRLGPDGMSDMGFLGGQATKAAYGREHYARIGALGGSARRRPA